MTPRAISAIQEYTYHTFESEQIYLSAIGMENNLNMHDQDTAQVVLPPTNHGQLKLTFAAKNNTQTTLCTNAATLKIKIYGNDEVLTATISTQKHILLHSKKNQKNQLSVQLVFLPETDPTCALDISVSSAMYDK